MVLPIAVWISIVIAWSASNTAGAVRVFPNSSPLWYRTESTVNLTCVADDFTKLNWFKNNVKMNIDYLNGFMMTSRQYSQPPSTISNLWKANVGISDSGVYSCHDVRQRHLEEQIDVRVLNVVGSDVTKQAGHSATLRCNPQNLKHEDFKRIEWRRDYGSIPVHQLPRVSQNDNSFALHLTSLDESDAGHYECIFTFETRTPDGSRQEISLSKRIRLDVLGYSDSVEEGNPTIMPENNPVHVLSPSTIMLTCKVSGQNDIQWEKDGVEIAPEGGKYKINVTKTSAAGIMESKSTLAVFNPTNDDQGQYSCFGEIGQKTSKLVRVLEVDATDANYTDGGTVVLGCRPKNLQDDDVLFNWSFNGTKINSDTDRATVVNNTLELTNLKPSDAGLYECEFIFVDRASERTTTLVQGVNLYSSPYVDSFEKSKNMVQGDTLKLKCRVYGHPTPVVTWKREGVEIQPGEDERINIKDLEEDSKLVSKGGLLTIFDLKFEDRANYRCEANNTFGSSNSTILVRVKDKLAALWPFLGIVAEVAILCGIIFIYEKKRSKESDDEEDAPLQKTPNAQDHKGTDEVRHRKA